MESVVETLFRAGTLGWTQVGSALEVDWSCTLVDAASLETLSEGLFFVFD